MATKQTHPLAATQIDRKISPLRAIAASLRPSSAGGWIRALRQGLGLSAAALGSRMRLAQQSVDKLEKNERAGAITLAYSAAPRKPSTRSYFTRSSRGNPCARLPRNAPKRLRESASEPVAHTMQLEAQGLADNELQERITELALELAQSPKVMALTGAHAPGATPLTEEPSAASSSRAPRAENSTKRKRRVNWELDPIRNEPQFKAIEARMNFPP